MVYYILLIIESTINALSFLLGIVIFLKAKENNIHKYWGLLAFTLGAMLFYHNIVWLKNYEHQFSSKIALLNINHMIKWFVLAYIFSLFPNAALYPKYLTQQKVILTSVPLIVITTLAFCFEIFDVEYTPVSSFSEVIANINKLDIRVRVFIYLSSILFPFVNIIAPIIISQSNHYRKATSGMYLFACYIFAATLSYTLLTFNSNPIYDTIFGCIVGLFPFLFSIFFVLKRENPFTAPRSHSILHNNCTNETAECCSETITTNERTKIKRPQMMIKNNHPKYEEITLLYYQLNSYMKEEQPFTDPRFDEWAIVKQLSTTYELLQETLQGNGFINFREYVAFWRIQHFKELAKTRSKPQIKSLLFECGYNSRATFYRNFESFEEMTPREYVLSISTLDDNKECSKELY